MFEAKILFSKIFMLQNVIIPKWLNPQMLFYTLKDLIHINFLYILYNFLENNLNEKINLYNQI